MSFFLRCLSVSKTMQRFGFLQLEKKIRAKYHCWFFFICPAFVWQTNCYTLAVTAMTANQRKLISLPANLATLHNIFNLIRFAFNSVQS